MRPAHNARLVPGLYGVVAACPCRLPGGTVTACASGSTARGGQRPVRPLNDGEDKPPPACLRTTKRSFVAPRGMARIAETRLYGLDILSSVTNTYDLPGPDARDPSALIRTTGLPNSVGPP